MRVFFVFKISVCLFGACKLKVGVLKMSEIYEKNTVKQNSDFDKEYLSKRGKPPNDCCCYSGES